MDNSPRDPLSLLTEDAWLEVLKYLDPDPRDLLNVGATCTFFDDLLETQRVAGRGSGQGACQLQEVVPLILKWLTKDQVLLMRLICKRVKEATDLLLAEHTRILPYENLNMASRLMPPHCLTFHWPLEDSYEFRNFKMPFGMQQIVTSMEHIQAIGKNLKGGNKMLWKLIQVVVPTCPEEIELDDILPLIHRALNNHDDSDSDTSDEEEPFDMRRADELCDAVTLKQDIFLDRAIQMFQIYPQEFKYVKIRSHDVTNYRAFRSIFIKLVGSLPNLCFLDVDCDREFRIRPDVSPAQLEAAFVPLPRSPKLERLSVKNYIFPEAFLRQISATYGNHLKHLEVELSEDEKADEMGDKLWREEFDINPGQRYDLNSLLFLTVTQYMCDTPRTLFRINSPQLKGLRLHEFFDRLQRNLDQFIRLILNFPSISFLDIDVVPYIVGDPIAAMKILENYRKEDRMQNLKVLIVRGPVFNSNLPLRAFTTLCPNLCKIMVHTSNLAMSRDLDFNLLRDRRLEYSMIWQDAPQLELVSLVDGRMIWNGNRFAPYVCMRPKEQEE